MTYPFAGEQEELRAVKWMVGKLQKRDCDPDEQIIKEELLTEISERLEVMKNKGPRASLEWYDDLWDRFIFAMSGVWPDEAEETWTPPFEQGEWELDRAQELPFGHSKYHKMAKVPEGGGSATHTYRKPPPDITWRLTSITQKDLTFFVGKATVSEIDAVCSVPQLPQEIDSEEAGRRVLNSNLGEKEWQRRVEARRIVSISKFIGGAGNIIANSAILYAARHRAVDAKENGKISVDFSKFLHRQGDEWSDHKGAQDMRPIWLIDGQHRTRGLAQSPEGIDLEIPIILFPPTFSLKHSAKIFAEINTLQKRLTQLHTLFMQHRFSIPSPVGKRDFRQPWKANDRQTWDSRANHLSYECAAYLASSEESPLRGRIRILDQNQSRMPIIQASQWVDFARGWYLDGGIYPPDTTQTAEEMNKEVENFFRAFVATCNHSGFPDDRPRWSPGAHNKGLVQRQGPSQSLLKLYPTVWRQAKAGSNAASISEKKFAEVLRPLYWVDWLDDKLNSTYGVGGERGRTALRVWMEAAVKHGHQYPLTEVMSGTIKSQPGRGILAPPGNSNLRLEDGPAWPAVGQPVTLVADQPPNTLPTSKWAIWDSTGYSRTPESNTVVAKDNTARVQLHYAEWMRNASSIRVRVEWQNMVDPAGFAEIKLSRRS